MLLGCEQIIARMWWEMQHNMHTPIAMQLHELASRVFDAAGNPNPLAQDPDRTQWSPKGVLSLLDALEAIEWALTLVRMSTEAAV